MSISGSIAKEGYAGKVVAVLQARMGSSRLPGKAMKPILGRPMIYYCFHQLSFSKEIDKVVLATSTLPENDVLAEYAGSLGYDVFRGSEDDVLGRYLLCAKEHQADIIVRITGDEPLIDPFITDEVIQFHKKSGADYTSTKISRTLPQGIDSEVFSMDVLAAASQEAMSEYEREHVTPFIYANPGRFRIVGYESREFRNPDLVLTVDEKIDFERVERIIAALFREGFPITVKEVLEYMEKKG